MIVMKFGGSSVADRSCLERVCRLVAAESGPKALVVSAMGKTTDQLIRAGELAASGDWPGAAKVFSELRGHHEAHWARDAASQTVLQELMAELESLLRGKLLMKEQTSRSRALLVSFGERLSVHVVAAHLREAGLKALPFDAREFVRTDSQYQNARVLFEDTKAAAQEALSGALDAGVIPVITGFLGADSTGVTSTLGRGGSDYSATLLGYCLDAREVWIWTDVSGILSADPRLVKDAYPLAQVSYREAAEMSFFGARVIHPKTIVPALKQNIPVRIKNTFEPEAAGTLITADATTKAQGVKTVSSVHELALITVEGQGLAGQPGTARRIFEASERASANVLMISQASSEQSVSLLVRDCESEALMAELRELFQWELERGLVTPLTKTSEVAAVSIVGSGMAGKPGVAGTLFQALGRVGVNVLAIAQGATELSISVAVSESQAEKAVRAIHSVFGLTKVVYLVLLGAGRVGRRFMDLLDAHKARWQEHFGIELRLVGVLRSQHALFEEGGLGPEDWGRLQDQPAMGPEAVMAWLNERHLTEVVLIDCTASTTTEMHKQALSMGFHVVTANKIPLSSSTEDYQHLMNTQRRQGCRYEYETTFGAGLPVLHTLKELVLTGDELLSVSGCLSGTLGYLCTLLEDGKPLSEAVSMAQREGYTEPDPRDDLSGLDVMRKAVIIARAMGLTLEQSDVDLEPLVPGLEHGLAESVREFEPELARRVDAAAERGEVLRYVARVTAEGCRVALVAVPRGSAIGSLKGPDNILVFETRRYKDYPLVIRGPGAGVEVTAAGVLGDVLKVVRP